VGNQDTTPRRGRARRVEAASRSTHAAALPPAVKGQRQMAPNRWALLNFRATNQNDLDSFNEILESFGVSLSPNPSPSPSR